MVIKSKEHLNYKVKWYKEHNKVRIRIKTTTIKQLQ